MITILMETLLKNITEIITTAMEINKALVRQTENCCTRKSYIKSYV